MGGLNRPNLYSGISKITRSCVAENSWPARIVGPTLWCLPQAG